MTEVTVTLPTVSGLCPTAGLIDESGRESERSNKESGTISHALLRLHADGDGAAVLDALTGSPADVRQSASRPPPNYYSDRGETRPKQLRDADRCMKDVERANVAVYWLTYSPFLSAFTERPHVRDRETPAEQRADWRHRDDPVPIPEPPPGDLLSGLAALHQLTAPDVADLLVRRTGGEMTSFINKNGLEEMIQSVSREIHRQYILSFEPPSAGLAAFRSIHVIVKGHPELNITARTGYWALP